MTNTEIFGKSKFSVNKSVEGKWLADEVNSLTIQGESITKSMLVPEYTRPEDGVQAQHNPRTDKFDIMLEKMDHATKLAKSNYLRKIGVLNSNADAPE